MTNKLQTNTFLLTLFGFEKAKSKAHVLLVILIHIAGWCLFFFLPVLLYPVRINDNRFIIHELIDKTILVALFYLNYYLLIPRLFEKKRYLVYFSFIILLLFIYLAQHVAIRSRFIPRPGDRFQLGQFSEPAFNRNSTPCNYVTDNTLDPADTLLLHPSFHKPLPTADQPEIFPPRPVLPGPAILGLPGGAWLRTLNNAISSFALLLLMGGFLRLAHSFLRNQNEKKVLENANLNAEVNFLKSQINPHFLFNTLNSIYSQAHARSANTEFSILKLSELLRYVLYDSGDEKVALEKDIQYINNYIDLQRLRLSQKIRLNYSVTGELQGKRIAPLLLINFIENAFKHGISYSQPSSIDVTITIFEETLTLAVVNPITETDSFVRGGLGLKNVGRRLELLYPNRHQLEIQQNDSLYIVNLKIELNHD